MLRGSSLLGIFTNLDVFKGLNIKDWGMIVLVIWEFGYGHGNIKWCRWEVCNVYGIDRGVGVGLVK